MPIESPMFARKFPGARRRALGLHSRLPIRVACPRSVRASALIETAIVAPAYMLVLFGLIFFGYATLGRQRQEIAAAYAGSRQPGQDEPARLLEDFLPWADPEDTEIELPVDKLYTSDLHYAEGTIESQLVDGKHSLTGGSGNDYSFDLERVAVSLWNLALPEIRRNPAWSEEQGIAAEETLIWDDASRYLNSRSGLGTGFIDAPISLTESPPAPNVGQEHNSWVARAFTGTNLNNPWMKRRRVHLDQTYSPPFANIIHGGVSFTEPSAVRKSTFSKYVTLDYPEPVDPFVMRTRFEITNRGAAERASASSESRAFLGEVADLFERDRLGDPDAMGDSLDRTVNPWKPPEF